MTENKPISKSRDTLYRVVIILIVAVAAYSNATKELNRLQEMMGGAHEFTEAGLGGLAKVYAATRSLSESSRVTSTPEISAGGFDWNGPVATGGSIEIKGLDQDINAAPADSHEMEVFANNSTNNVARNLALRSDKHAVDIRGVDFLKGLTAKAIYPGTRVASDQQKSSCDLAKDIQLNVSSSEVSRRVLDTIPVGLGLLERAVNEKVDASTLPETVIANVMNRRIRITRKGYARPRTKSEVPPKKDSADWPNAIKFMKVALYPASTTSAEVDVDMFKREISPDVQLHSPVKMSYRYISGESEMSDSN